MVRSEKKIRSQSEPESQKLVVQFLIKRYFCDITRNRLEFKFHDIAKKRNTKNVMANLLITYV